MRNFRLSARKHSRASARIGILGGALLVMLWIGLSASVPGGGVTAAPEGASARFPVQTPIPAAATAQMDNPAPAAASLDGVTANLPNFCVPDVYEPDNSIEQAKPLTMNGVPQIHGFDTPFDKDWYVVDGLIVGQWYNAATSHLVTEADTLMVLYDVNRNELKNHDDVGQPCNLAHLQNCASSISWRATYTGPYYISVLTWTYPIGTSPSRCPGYDMTGRTLRNYLPLVMKMPTPTPRNTFTPTPIRDSHSDSDTHKDVYAYRDPDSHDDAHAAADLHPDSNLDEAAGCHRRAGLQLSQRCGR